MWQQLRNLKKQQSHIPRWQLAGLVAIFAIIGARVGYFVGQQETARERLDIPGQLAFVSTRDGNFSLWQMNADGTDKTRILRTRGDAVALHPLWSPDGSMLAYTGADCETCLYNVFVMNADGSDLRSLSGFIGGGNYEDPQWSPDGSELLVVRADRDTGYKDIYRIEPNGAGLRNLTETPEIDEFQPTWSPDEATIAYTSDQSGNRDIWTMTREGEFKRNLTDSQATEGAPTWSPDGAEIAYIRRDVGAATYDLWLMDANDGSHAHLLADSDRNMLAPAWSPDGTQLVVQEALGQEDSVLTRIDSNTGEARILTAGEGHAFAHAWSPDGLWIAFTLDDEIAMMRADGSDLTRITAHRGLDQFPDWFPHAEP